jgi:NADH-quinone oxidoreductase subunit E
VGAWKARFEEEQGAGGTSPAATGETQAANATSPGDPKAAKPDAGRAIESSSADTPAERSANGESPIGEGAKREAAEPVPPRPLSDGQAPRTEKSYVATPSHAEEGKPAAPPARQDGSETKHVGADPDASPGVAPKG